MKKLHKILALTLALSLLLLSACGPKEEPANPYVSGDVIVLDKITDPVLTITGYPASTVVAKAGEQEITLGDVLYWMAVSGDQLLQYYGYLFNGEIPWSQTDEEGATLEQMMKQDCLRTAGLYALLPEKLAQAGLEPSQEALDQAESTLESMRNELETDEEFNYNMWYYFLTPELYRKLISAQSGLQMLKEHYYGEGGESYPDDGQMYAQMEQEGYYFVKHILLATVDTTTREPLDEETAAQKKKEAEDLLTQLESSAEPAALFDQLMNQFSEDPGLASSPDGYLAQPGQMVEPFETASLALGDYEISGLVESEHGYHIILRIPLKDAIGTEELAAYRESYVDTKMQERMDGWLEESPAKGNELFEGMDLPLYYEGLTALREAIQTELTPAGDAASGSSSGSGSGDSSAKG